MIECTIRTSTMKHLFLIRHAKSSWADESLADRDRPLNNRGEQQLQPLGKALQRLEVFQSSDVFASDATRARQTARGILPADFPSDRFHIDPGLYTFDFKRLLEWLKKLDDSIERSEEHTSELQSRPHLVCRLLLEKKKNKQSMELGSASNAISAPTETT